LNHTLLTVEAARLRGLRVAGVVLNGAEPTADPLAEATNPGELARRLDGIPVLADLPFSADPGPLWSAPETVDWYERALPPRYVAALIPVTGEEPGIDPDPGAASGSTPGRP
jgi:dethiobiotin synthetase